VVRTARLPFTRILMTGGNGFVGGYLAPILADASPDASRLMLTRPGSGAAGRHWASANAEIEDDAAVDRIVQDFRPDLVLHLAAQASVGASQTMAETTWRVNFGGSLALASACAKHAPRATVLFVSSAETYGASFKDGPASEDTPLQPLNAYARSKAAAEQMLGDVLPPESRLIVVRAFNHTGPGQDERFVLPSFAAQIARIESGRQPPHMETGNLDAARDFLDVRDVCEAYLALLAAAPELPMRNVFNVASGEGRKIADLLAILRGHATAQFELRLDPARLRPSDIPSAIGRNERLAAATGWAPRRPLETTLRDLLQHAREAAR
jgi:GDP-4-dehydro-6-deoxy-D-mannose reductase